jgi:hypothetical protein
MKSKKIVVLGFTNTDMVITGKKIPVPGETVSGLTFAVFLYNSFVVIMNRLQI